MSSQYRADQHHVSILIIPHYPYLRCSVMDVSKKEDAPGGSKQRIG